jgi:hypothetical protein
LLVVVRILVPVRELEEGAGNFSAILVGGSLELLKELESRSCGALRSLMVRVVVVLVYGQQ